jgi:hypothetical protein
MSTNTKRTIEVLSDFVRRLICRADIDGRQRRTIDKLRITPNVEDVVVVRDDGLLPDIAQLVIDDDDARETRH